MSTALSRMCLDETGIYFPPAFGGDEWTGHQHLLVPLTALIRATLQAPSPPLPHAFVPQCMCQRSEGGEWCLSAIIKYFGSYGPSDRILETLGVHRSHSKCLGMDWRDMQKPFVPGCRICARKGVREGGKEGHGQFCALEKPWWQESGACSGDLGNLSSSSLFGSCYQMHA